MLKATEEYRAESDQFARFLQDCTIQSSKNQLAFRTLTLAFKRWCEENGENPCYKTSQKICHYLRHAGYEMRKLGHAKKSHVFGIQLINEEEHSDLPAFGA